MLKRCHKNKKKKRIAIEAAGLCFSTERSALLVTVVVEVSVLSTDPSDVAVAVFEMLPAEKSGSTVAVTLITT